MKVNALEMLSIDVDGYDQKMIKLQKQYFIDEISTKMIRPSLRI